MTVDCAAAAEEGQSGTGKPARAGTRGACQSTLETHGQAGGRETVLTRLSFVTSSNHRFVCATLSTTYVLTSFS